MPYRLDLRGATDATLDRLVELGAIDLESNENSIAALMPDDVAAADVVKALDITDYAVSTAIGRDTDSVWRLSRASVRVDGHAVELTDTPVFGSGMHPTTVLCLEMLVYLVAQDSPDRMLDVGTGSGVLAIAALKLGVPRATAVDIDAEAIGAAVDHARRNHVRERLCIVRGGPDAVSGQWPLVVANILAAPLIEMAPVIVRRVAPRGRLVLSGIPDGVDGDVERAYRRLGMHRSAAASRGGWVALQLLASW